MDLLRKFVEDLSFDGRELVRQLRALFDERLSVGEILQPLRSPTRRVVASRTEFLVQKIDDSDDAKRYVIHHDLVGTIDGDRQARIISELNGRPVGGQPVLGVAKHVVKPECRGGECVARNGIAAGYGDADIERRSRFLLMNLNRQTSDDRIGNARVTKDAAQRHQSGPLALFHFTSQPVPLPVEKESGRQTSAHDGDCTPRALPLPHGIRANFGYALVSLTSGVHFIRK